MRKNQLMLPRPSRHRVRIPCQVVRLRDFKLVGNCIEKPVLGRNSGGPGGPGAHGEPLFLSFRLPCSQHWIDTEATVARVIHGRREGDQPANWNQVRVVVAFEPGARVASTTARSQPFPPALVWTT